MKKTQELIDGLSRDLSPKAMKDRFQFRFWMSFALLVSFTGLCTAYIARNWPHDAHLPEHISFVYLIEAALWFAGAIAAGWIAFDGGFPGPARRSVNRVAGAIFATAAGCILWKWSSLSMVAELPLEMDVLRGRCGFFIVFSSVATSAWMFVVIRHAAPTRLSWAGLWGAASMACVGAFFMHLVCPHDNPLHLISWHFIPIVLLMTLGALLGNRVLRWA